MLQAHPHRRHVPTVLLDFATLRCPSDVLLGFDPCEGDKLVGMCVPANEEDGITIQAWHANLASRTASELAWSLQLDKMPSRMSAMEEILHPTSLSMPSPRWLVIARAAEDAHSREVQLIVAPLPRRASSSTARSLLLRSVLHQKPFPELAGAFHSAACDEGNGFVVAFELGHGVRVCQWSSQVVKIGAWSWWTRCDNDAAVCALPTRRGTSSDLDGPSPRLHMFCADFDCEDFMSHVLPKRLGVRLAATNRQLASEAAVVKDYCLQFVKFTGPVASSFEVCLVCHVLHAASENTPAAPSSEPWLLALVVELDLTGSFVLASSRKARITKPITPDGLARRCAKIVNERRAHADDVALRNDAVLSGVPVQEPAP
jgi:hypothetical protein